MYGFKPIITVVWVQNLFQSTSLGPWESYPSLAGPIRLIIMQCMLRFLSWFLHKAGTGLWSELMSLMKPDQLIMHCCGLKNRFLNQEVSLQPAGETELNTVSWALWSRPETDDRWGLHRSLCSLREMQGFQMGWRKCLQTVRQDEQQQQICELDRNKSGAEEAWVRPDLHPAPVQTVWEGWRYAAVLRTEDLPQEPARWVLSLRDKSEPV